MVEKMIKEEELSKARIAWGNGIIEISRVYEEQGIQKATTTADLILDDLYGFDFGPILFKPTLSGGAQTFRSTKEGALSYFIGNNPKYPFDKGFGIKYWRKVESETSSIFINENVAMWMGWVTLTNKDGAIVKVDKSWGYKKSADGSLKIILHHSSLPYEA
jgi:hypothetical protein